MATAALASPLYLLFDGLAEGSSFLVVALGLSVVCLPLHGFEGVSLLYVIPMALSVHILWLINTLSRRSVGWSALRSPTIMIDEFVLALLDLVSPIALF